MITYYNNFINFFEMNLLLIKKIEIIDDDNILTFYYDENYFDFKQ